MTFVVSRSRVTRYVQRRFKCFWSGRVELTATYRLCLVTDTASVLCILKRPFCLAELMKHYHTASVIVYAVRIGTRMQTSLLTRLRAGVKQCIERETLQRRAAARCSRIWLLDPRWSWIQQHATFHSENRRRWIGTRRRQTTGTFC